MMNGNKSSCRILLWTDSDRFAGTERHCLELACGLQQLGLEVAMGCRLQTPLAQKAAAQGVRLVALDARAGGIPAIARLSGLLKRGGVDLLHVHNGKCALLARIALARAGRGTLVATQHFIQPARTLRRGMKARVARRLHRWVDRGVSRWVSISTAVSEAMVHRGDTSSSKVSLVFNGVAGASSSELDRNAARELLGLPCDMPVLVCVARLEEEKGHGVLLDALKMVSCEKTNFLTLLVGEGSLEGTLTERIRELGISNWVRLVGQQPDISVWLRAADALVLPSPAEPFGLVLLEAMSRGIPAVAAAAGGPLEILHAGGGLLFKPDDPRDLGGTLLRLMSQDVLRRELGEKGFSVWANRFRVERMVHSMLCVYESAVGAGVGGSG